MFGPMVAIMLRCLRSFMAGGAIVRPAMSRPWVISKATLSLSPFNMTKSPFSRFASFARFYVPASMGMGLAMHNARAHCNGNQPDYMMSERRQKTLADALAKSMKDMSPEDRAKADKALGAALFAGVTAIIYVAYLLISLPFQIIGGVWGWLFGPKERVTLEKW